MRIKFSPQRSDEILALTKNGEVLIINGEEFDFAPIPEGATLPAHAIQSSWIIGSVERIDGEIVMTVRLPCGKNPSQAQAFPKELVDAEDGDIHLPGAE